MANKHALGIIGATFITLFLMLLTFLLSGCSVSANELTDMPIAKAQPVQHHYWDRWTRIQLVAGVSMASMDMHATCRNFDVGPHPYENGIPAHNCTQAVLFTAGEQLGALGVSYLLHKTGHHKLERIPGLYLLGANAHGFLYSRSHP